MVLDDTSIFLCSTIAKAKPDQTQRFFLYVELTSFFFLKKYCLSSLKIDMRVHSISHCVLQGHLSTNTHSGPLTLLVEIQLRNWLQLFWNSLSLSYSLQIEYSWHQFSQNSHGTRKRLYKHFSGNNHQSKPCSNLLPVYQFPVLALVLLHRSLGLKH